MFDHHNLKRVIKIYQEKGLRAAQDELGNVTRADYVMRELILSFNASFQRYDKDLDRAFSQSLDGQEFVKNIMYALQDLDGLIQAFNALQKKLSEQTK